jgi:hypothetical protein
MSALRLRFQNETPPRTGSAGRRVGHSKDTPVDRLLAIIWRVMRDFPEAGAALREALRRETKEEPGDELE